METVQVSLGARSYDISVAQDLFTSYASIRLLSPFAKGVKVLIVSDSNVFPLYGDLLHRTLLVAGASAVAVGTAILTDPMAPVRILEELDRFCDDRGISEVRSLTGTLEVW